MDKSGSDMADMEHELTDCFNPSFSMDKSGSFIDSEIDVAKGKFQS